FTMVEEVMFAQSFAMVGSDDHPRSIEHTTTFQFVEQLTQPLVQISETVVIAISSQVPVVLRQLSLVEEGPAVEDDPVIIHSLGPGTERVRASFGQAVWGVGIQVIEEDEEGTPRLMPVP